MVGCDAINVYDRVRTGISRTCMLPAGAGAHVLRVRTIFFFIIILRIVHVQYWSRNATRRWKHCTALINQYDAPSGHSKAQTLPMESTPRRLCHKKLLPTFQNTCHHWLLSATLTNRLIRKIVRVRFILFVICLDAVCILSLTYHFTCLRWFFLNKTNGKSGKKKKVNSEKYF
jgi:hypothetical protein